MTSFQTWAVVPKWCNVRVDQSYARNSGPLLSLLNPDSQSSSNLRLHYLYQNVTALSHARTYPILLMIETVSGLVTTTWEQSQQTKPSANFPILASNLSK